MKCENLLTPIPWETRNLNRKSFSVNTELCAEIEKHDVIKLLNEKSNENIFVQARIEKSNISLISTLEKAGFQYMESTLDPYSRLNKNNIFQEFQSNKDKFLPRRYPVTDFVLKKLVKSDVDMSENIRAIAQNSFIADRFHVDPACPKEMADDRYVYWVNDLLEDDDVNFLVLYYGDDPISFFAHKSEYLILAGFVRIYANKGLGDFFWLSVLENIAASDYNSVHTRISLNNIPVLNLYARIGFKFKNPATVLHYWNSI